MELSDVKCVYWYNLAQSLGLSVSEITSCAHRMNASDDTADDEEQQKMLMFRLRLATSHNPTLRKLADALDNSGHVQDKLEAEKIRAKIDESK